VVAVGQELLLAASVLDPDDPRLGKLAHGPVDGVDRAAQPPREGGPGRHTAARAVSIAQQERVEPERGVGDGRVDDPLWDDRETGLLDEEGAVEVVGGT